MSLSYRLTLINTVDGVSPKDAQRAATYERVYFKPERQRELREMEAWLPSLFGGRDVLEVACGTGWWTPHGARDSRSWLATDLNPETMALARAKPLPVGKVRFAGVDAYALDGLAGQGPFNAAFTGCWWSHVPLQRLDGWLAQLHARLAPGSVVVMLDNRFVREQSTPLTRRDEAGNTYQNRTLDDGSVHEVLKNFPTAEQAIARLGPRAHSAQWHAWEHHWALVYELH
jgi:demethylmenaquinone methyltransferase/2-methoxy-6-polyprenyl-1,4-benzoquinol methylase